MATRPRAAELQQKVSTYEATLRRLLADADEEAKLWAYIKSERLKGPSEQEIGTHDTLQRIRKVVAFSLNKFHPEITLE